jgi:flagellar hook-associated protein 2
VTATPVALTSTRPATALSQAMADFVETYNQVYAAAKEQTDPATGDLKTDPAAKALLRSLQGMTTRTLTSGGTAGAPTTLAQLGVSTNRDGTLTLDTNAMNKAMAAYPDEVEAMFATTSGNALGLNSVLSGIALSASSSVTGLGASATRYGKAQKDLAGEQDKITAQSAAMTTRMTQQFSSMNSKVTAYKATQTFLDNQIKAWNKNS